VCGAESPLPWLPACHAHMNNFTDTTFSENMELDSCLKVSFTHLVLSSVSICYSWTQMSVFSSLNWWIGCCIVLLVCTNPSRFQCPQFEVVWWCGDITSDPLLSATKGYTMQHFLFFPPILDSTEARGLSPLWLLGILSQTRQIKVCTIFICSSGGVHFNALVYLYMSWM